MSHDLGAHLRRALVLSSESNETPSIQTKDRLGNSVDYPMLMAAMVPLLRSLNDPELASERNRVLYAILDGLSGDPEALTHWDILKESNPGRDANTKDWVSFHASDLDPKTVRIYFDLLESHREELKQFFETHFQVADSHSILAQREIFPVYTWIASYFAGDMHADELSSIPFKTLEAFPPSPEARTWLSQIKQRQHENPALSYAKEMDEETSLQLARYHYELTLKALAHPVEGPAADEGSHSSRSALVEKKTDPVNSKPQPFSLVQYAWWWAAVALPLIAALLPWSGYGYAIPLRAAVVAVTIVFALPLTWIVLLGTLFVLFTPGHLKRENFSEALPANTVWHPEVLRFVNWAESDEKDIVWVEPGEFTQKGRLAETEIVQPYSSKGSFHIVRVVPWLVVESKNPILRAIQNLFIPLVLEHEMGRLRDDTSRFLFLTVFPRILNYERTRSWRRWQVKPTPSSMPLDAWWPIQDGLHILHDDLSRALGIPLGGGAFIISKNLTHPLPTDYDFRNEKLLSLLWRLNGINPALYQKMQENAAENNDYFARLHSHLLTIGNIFLCAWGLHSLPL